MEVAVDIFTRKFLQVLNVHAPWIIFQQRKHFSPWITDELKELIKERDGWKQKAKDLAIMSDGATTEEEKHAWNQFKFIRNKINNRKTHDESSRRKSLKKILMIQKKHGELLKAS